MMYEKMRETRRASIILTKYVKIKLSNNYKRYNGLGYNGRPGMEIDVLVSDLSDHSHAIILTRCPVCLSEREMQMDLITRYGHTLCANCAKTPDLKGEVFGRLTVIDLDTENSRRGSWWICKCECGVIKSVQAKSMVSGATVSCGCYHREVTREMSGDKSSLWGGGSVELVCELCGGGYTRNRARADSSRFCSSKCFAAWQSANMSGENSPLWKSEKSQEERVIGRKYQQYRLWVNKVLDRDGYTCKVCGNTRNLNVHHLYNYADYPRYRTIVKNGITLCEVCHAEFHKWMGGYGVGCTPSDFARWSGINTWLPT